jgi:hypothetical protein
MVEEFQEGNHGPGLSAKSKEMSGAGKKSAKAVS